MEKREIILEGRNLSVGYGNGKHRNVIRRALDFSLCGGELVSLLGANGTGKSTLLRTLAGVQRPLDGELSLMGRAASAYSERERSRLIGIVLTEQTQAGGLTVRELVALGRQPHTGFFGRLNKHDEERVDDALCAVGMSEKSGRYVSELSDGERQKTMIAKALVQECPLILLDEPTAFLDMVSRIEIVTLLHRLAQTENRAVLFSTHDVEQALLWSDKLWVLPEQGGILCGNTEDLVLSGAMDELFPRREVSFDVIRGGFLPASSSENPVILHAASEELFHCGRNALVRNGYACVQATGTTADEAGIPRLDIRAADKLLYSSGGQTAAYASFGSLLDFLRSAHR